MLHFQKSFSLLLLLLQWQDSIASFTYYVAPTDAQGADDAAGYGTRSQPFKTLKYAAKQAQPGDQLVLLDGVYKNKNYGDGDIWKDGSTFWIKNLAGTEENPIVIRGDTPTGHTLRGDCTAIFQCRGCRHVVIDRLNIVGEVQNIPLQNAINDRFKYKLENGDDTIYNRMDPNLTPTEIDAWFDAGNELQLLDTYRPSLYNTIGLLIHSSWKVVVQNCKVSYVPSTGLRVQNSDFITVKNNEVHDCSRRSSQGTNGIVAHTGNNRISGSWVNYDGYRFIFTGNIIYNNYNEVYSWVDTKKYVHPYIDEGKGMSMEHLNNNKWRTGRVLMANNVAYNNGLSGINSNNSDRLDIFHNTAYQNILSGVGNNCGISANDSKNVNVKNNLSVSINNWGGFAYNSRSPSGDYQQDGIIFENNMYVGQVKSQLPAQIEAGSSASDVGFVDAANHNFRLESTSPAIGRGLDLSNVAQQVAVDIDDTVRSSTPDLGAYEHTTSGTQAAATQYESGSGIINTGVVAPIATQYEGGSSIGSGSSGGAYGDPHFKTWSSEKYDFHGVCDLVLLRNNALENDVGLDIHIRTKSSRMWSYIHAAAIRVGSDILEIMGGNGAVENHFWVNKNKVNSTKDITLFGYPVAFKQLSSKSRRFVIDLGQGNKIEVKTWNKMVSVNIRSSGSLHGESPHFKGSLGLMGSFPNGEKIGRDCSTVIDDETDFGKEWQVLSTEPMLFHEVDRDTPQHPETCKVPSTTQLRRRLGKSIVSKADAKLACSHVTNPINFDSCVFDVIATNDKDSAGAYE